MEPEGGMGKGRMEAFSDGVFAVIITIMVLELKAQHVPEFQALWPVLPGLLCYVLSFVYVGIYWNNHHHMLAASARVSGGVLWSNLHLLFWLSLLPFTTAWMGQNHFAAAPTAVYGAVLLMTAVAWWLLQRQLICRNGLGSTLGRAVAGNWKTRASPLLYLCGILLSLRLPWLAQGIYALVALLWLVPDRRIERLLEEGQ